MPIQPFFGSSSGYWRGPSGRQKTLVQGYEEVGSQSWRAPRGVSPHAAPGDPLARTEPLARLEAALFAALEPVPPRKLARAAGLGSVRQVEQWVRWLNALYDREGSALNVEQIAGGYQLCTRAEYAGWLKGLIAPEPLPLSGPALETLAIVAYRQPIMRADIEQIRGAQSGEILRQLLDLGLIRVLGRHASLGRPLLYGTTRKFLQLFRLRSLSELPEAARLRRPCYSSKSVMAGHSVDNLDDASPQGTP